VAFDGASADVLLAPDAAGELVLAEDPCWVGGELDEQLEFQAAEAHGLAGDVDGSCGEVDGGAGGSGRAGVARGRC
jgi:hypothetical protein